MKKLRLLLGLSLFLTSGTLFAAADEIKCKSQCTNEIHKVEIRNFSYNPSSINARVGDSVQFTNKDSSVHTVVPTEDSFVKFNGSNILKTNDIFELVIEEPKNIKGQCSIHPHMPGFEINVID